jgi:hypothetical protein
MKHGTAGADVGPEVGFMVLCAHCQVGPRTASPPNCGLGATEGDTPTFGGAYFAHRDVHEQAAPPPPA